MDEEKDQISFRLLCNACLCVGTTLYPITDDSSKRYYLGALREIPICGLPEILPNICWDCKALLRRAIDFREQVKDSYRILVTYTNESLHECLFTDVSRPPRLNIKCNESINIEPEDNFQNGTEKIRAGKRENKVKKKQKEEEKALSDIEELKEELSNAEPPSLQETQEVFVKEEMKIECWDSDRDFSDAPEDQNTTQIDTLAEIDEQICSILTDDTNVAKKVKKKSKKSVERLRSKKKLKEAPGIQTIDLTYEELMAEREIEYTRDNYVNAEYKCESCILGFAYVKSLEAHMSAKHSNDIGNYTCPICKTVLASVDSFTAHYKRHTRRYECSICQKRTMDVKVMKQHYYSKHDLSFKKHTCADCGKISNSRDAHRYHVGTHKSRLQCPECDKTFRHRGGLLNHRLAVHELGNVFPCNLCDKVFRWKNSLKRHLDTHDTKNKSTSGAAYCAPCSVSFASLSSYQRHLNNSLKHVTKDDFRFICDHCKRRFADKTKLRDHIEEKHLHRSYHCEICVKVYKNRVNLDQHVRNVHKGRPNHKICHHCGKGFPTTVQLESHIRTHTGERPFICEFCPTTFSQQSNLYKHNRQVHLNMKTKRYPIAKKRKDERNDAILESSVQQIMPIEYAVDIEFPIV